MSTEPDATEESLDFRPSFFRRFRSDPPPTYWLTRFVFLRGLGLVYLVAFLVAANQIVPLVGADGILPAQWFLDDLRFSYGSSLGAFTEQPTLFLFVEPSDAALRVVSVAGAILAAALVAGASHAAIPALLWGLYMSIAHVGQVFYGYGWEILLLEAGFLAIFLCPLRSARPLATPDPPSPVIIWLLRWVVFRVMFGAGLIKLRGDPCWVELTCLEHHYETQPIPNPLSPFIHAMPAWFHAAGVLFNHFVELVVPFFVFGPRTLRHVAGALIVVFQLILIVSGNLSFLNWLTIVVAIACFDDRLLARLVPLPVPARRELGVWQRRVGYALLAVILVLSVQPALNLVSTRQIMNTSFDRLHLVNTYGAFGSINRERYEVVLEGTLDDAPSDDAEWRAYELPCKPGDLARAPCIVSPYHRRLDWQMWFAALSDYEHEDWIVRLVWLLLAGEPSVRELFASDPFGGDPPRFVRARLYRYEMTGGTDPWWRREPVGLYLRAVGKDDPELIKFLQDRGLLR